MASMKPQILAHFKKGVLMSAIDYLVDTLNWIVSCASGLTAGSGLKWSGIDAGTPKIDLALVAGDNVTIEDYGDGEKKISVEDVGGEVTVKGDGSSSAEGTEIDFSSASDSNLTFTVSQSSSGVVSVVVGCYYS